MKLSLYEKYNQGHNKHVHEKLQVHVFHTPTENSLITYVLQLCKAYKIITSCIRIRWHNVDSQVIIIKKQILYVEQEII